MSTEFKAARRFAEIIRLGDTVRRTADFVVARAHAARLLGSTAEQYRAGAQELGLQANRAEELLFGQAVKTLRAAADECELIAEALEVFETKTGA